MAALGTPMAVLGTPLSPSATRVLMCGSGELARKWSSSSSAWAWKWSRWTATPTRRLCRVAHRSHVVDMLDPSALRAVIERENPDFIVPEIEAIATGAWWTWNRKDITSFPPRGRPPDHDGRGYAGWPPRSSDFPRRPIASPNPRSLRTRGARNRLALRHQARHELIRQGTEHGAPCIGGGRRLAARARRDPRRRGQGDRRRIRRIRL